jgi:hypothetical protein
MPDNYILENLGFKKPDSRPSEIAELQVIDNRLAADKARVDDKGLIGKGVDAVLKLVWHADDQTQKGLVDLRVKVQDADQHHDVQALAKLSPQVNAAVNADVAAVKSESFREGASDFVSGVVTTAPLFMRGGRARALSVGVNALNDIQTNDGALGMTGDAIMGGAKGYALSVTFERVGRSKMSGAAKGLILGLGSRSEEGLLTSQNYRNDQGQFSLGTGFERTAGSVFKPYSLIIDAATFGTASTFTKTLSKNPLAANLAVGSMIGIISGASSEIQNQSQSGRYNATDIVSKALLSGASNLVSAGLGGHFEQTTLFNPRVATEGRLPGSMMLPHPEGSTTKPVEPQTPPAPETSQPTAQAPKESSPIRTGVLLPDWHVGPDNVDFVKTMTELVPRERNETALSLIKTVSDQGYRDRLVEARQNLADAFSHSGALIEWLQNKHLIDDPVHMADLIGQHPEVQEAYDHYTETAKPKQELLREIEPVRKQLEDGLNVINKENGLPPIKLVVSFSLEPGTAGIYKNAQIEVPPSDFAGGRSSKHVLDTLRHEEEHHVHECLVIAGTIEQIAGNEPIEKHTVQIQEALAKLRTTQDEDLIRAVDAKRNGLGPDSERLPLSPEERTRFEAICKSFEEEGKFRDIDFDLKTTNAMLDLIESGHLSQAIEELALLYAPKPDSEGLPAQAHEAQPIPDVFKEFMDEDTLRDWPLHEHAVELPHDQATLTRLAEELRTIGLAQKEKLEEQLGSESQRHETYLSWTHEREARDAEQELDTASLLLKYFKDHPFDANELPLENAPNLVLEIAQVSLYEGFPLETIRHFADYVSQGFYPDTTPPQVIRDLVGDEALKDWPHLSFDLTLSSQGDRLKQHILAFQDFLTAESTRVRTERSDRNADAL